MHPLVDVARTGVDAIALHPLRSIVCILVLVAVLLPHQVGQAIAEGLRAEAETSALAGADLTVSGVRHGRPAPLPASAVEEFRRLEGVVDAMPRITGQIVLGKEAIPALIVGLPAGQLPDWSEAIDGELPRPGGPHQFVIGSVLARRLNLTIGSYLPPFYRNDQHGERLARVVGIFRRDAPPWQAHLVLTTLESAAAIFEQSGLVTEVLLTIRPGYGDAVQRAISQQMIFDGPLGVAVRPRVVAREDLLALLPRGILRTGGAYNLHFVLLFVAAILVLLVTSGLGLGERRREIGILKATGWQTDEILLRGLVESLCLAVSAAAVAFLLAWCWLRLLNGFVIAGYFLPGAGLAPDFDVPYRLAPGPLLVGFVLALVLVLCGTLYSTWRAAIVPPRVAMR